MLGDGLRGVEQPLIPAAILAVPAQGRGQRSRSVSCCQLSNLGHFSVLNGVCGGDHWGKTGFTTAVDFCHIPFSLVLINNRQLSPETSYWDWSRKKSLRLTLWLMTSTQMSQLSGWCHNYTTMLRYVTKLKPFFYDRNNKTQHRWLNVARICLQIFSIWENVLCSDENKVDLFYLFIILFYLYFFYYYYNSKG